MNNYHFEKSLLHTLNHSTSSFLLHIHISFLLAIDLMYLSFLLELNSGAFVAHISSLLIVYHSLFIQLIDHKLVIKPGAFGTHISSLLIDGLIYLSIQLELNPGAFACSYLFSADPVHFIFIMIFFLPLVIHIIQESGSMEGADLKVYLMFHRLQAPNWSSN